MSTCGVVRGRLGATIDPSRVGSSTRCSVLWWLAVLLLGCGASTPDGANSPRPVQAASAAPSVKNIVVTPQPEPEVALRSGALAAHVRPGVMQAPIVAHYRGVGYDIVGLSLALKESEARTVQSVRIDRGGLGVVATGALFSDAGDGEAALPEGPVLWALVPLGRVRSVRGTLIRAVPGRAGELISFEASGAPPPAQFNAVEAWADAVHDRYASVGTPYHTYLSQRLGHAFARRVESPGSGIDDPVDFMSQLLLFSGTELARQSFVQDHHSLWSRHRWPQVPLSALEPPKSFDVPYAALGRQRSLTFMQEPLAGLTPKDFYYLRAEQVTLLPTLLGRLGQLELPGLVSGEIAHDRGLWKRYVDELGLTDELVESASARCDAVAIVGSDLYWTMGSDITLLISSSDPEALAQAVEESVNSFGVNERSWKLHAGQRIDFAYNSQGLRHHRALMPGVLVLSNSLAAIKRVIDAKQNQHALSAAPDFQYLMARDAELGELVFFVGRDFIKNSQTPERVILQLRRQLAQAELQVPLFASLAYGQLFGRLSTTRRALVGTQLIRAGDLEHRDGHLMRFKPNEIPSSIWGTPNRLTSLIDLKPPLRARRAEAEAYKRYAEAVELGAGSLRSPSLLSLSLQGHPSAPQNYELRFRSLPLHPGYGEYMAAVGASLVYPLGGQPGVRFRMALAQQGAWRDRLSGLLQDSSGAEIDLRALGTWLEVGAEDRTTLAEVAKRLVHFPQFPKLKANPSPPQPSTRVKAASRVPGLSELWELRGAPVYVQVGVSDEQAVRAAIHNWVSSLEKQQGGTQLRELGQYAGVPVNSLELRPNGCRSQDCALTLYFSVTKRRLALALNQQTLTTLLKEIEAGTTETGAWPTTPVQLTLRSSARKQGGLRKLIQWGLEAQLRGKQTPAIELVESLYDGDPSLEKDQSYVPRARHWFGFAPVTVDGQVYEWVEDGISDPRRGTLASPAWGASTPASSPLLLWRRLLDYSDVGVNFEREGTVDGAPLHSLLIRAKSGN